MNIADLRAYAVSTNVQAFLRVIRAGESNQTDDAYTILFGGSHFEGFAEHPNQRIPFGNTFSTAAGAYQFLHRTWTGLVKQYGFPDFSPESQDLGAIALIVGRGAIADVINGDLVAALPKCAKEWASLPGSPYGQPTISEAKCEAVFRQYGGMLVGGQGPYIEVAPPDEPIVITTQPPAPVEERTLVFKEKSMGALAMFGPLIAQLIPAVAKLFGGGEVAQRNVAVGQLVLDTAVKAANAVNEQEAIDKMKADPAVLQAVTQAVVTLPAVLEVLEVGGGIVKAREAASDPNQIPFWRNPAFVVTGLLLPLLYMVVGAVVLNYGGNWSEEMRSVVVTAIVTGLLGSITGFFLGSSLGSQKKTDAALK